METLEFRTGTYPLHHDPNFNYQLNRAVMLSGGALDEIRSVTNQIKDIPTWIETLLSLADKAKAEKRTPNALAYIRAAEFFMNESNTAKETLYREYKALFYEVHGGFIASQGIKRIDIGYEKGSLPVFYAAPETGSLGTLVIHGGFDSYMEEFLPALLYCKELGFAVYLFEGPGQGECIHKQKIPFTLDWHKPVGAVLNYFGLEDVTLIGISLGSLLALRAAAWEKRIKRVVAWSIMENFYDVLLSSRPKALRVVLDSLIKAHAKGAVNSLAKAMMEKEPYAAWGIEQGKYVFGQPSAYDFLAEAKKYNLRSLSGQITQDVLLLGAAEDHFIPLSMYKNEIDCLTKVKSLTFRLFTKEESAESHCNIGNMPLALNTVCSWITAMETPGL